MSFEQPQRKDDMFFWSVAEWKSNILAADKGKRLAFFNDVTSGKDAPAPENSKHLVLQNVSLGGKLCDIYHWGQVDGNMEPQSSVNRVYVHIKE